MQEQINFNQNPKDNLINLRNSLRDESPSQKVSTSSIETEFRVKKGNWFQKVIQNFEQIFREGLIEDIDTLKEMRRFIEYSTSPEFHTKSTDYMDDIKWAHSLIDKVVNLIK